MRKIYTLCYAIIHNPDDEESLQSSMYFEKIYFTSPGLFELAKDLKSQLSLRAYEDMRCGELYKVGNRAYQLKVHFRGQEEN